MYYSMKKWLCFLLAALMLFGTMACGTGDEMPGDTVGQTEAATEAETADPNYICDLPNDLDYGGKEVGILCDNVTGRDDELASENASGVVSDAVHERNVLVEDSLKVKLVLYPEDDYQSVPNALKKDVESGTGVYDIVSNATHVAVTPALEGYYLNLNALEYIDTSKHYWTQGYNDMMTFTDDDMQFLASGSMAISMYRYMFLTLYNKTLFTDNKIPDLYETVKAGEWTLDYQYSITKDHYVDKDGDSKHSEGDFYGFVTGNVISVDPYMVAANLHLITKDPDTGDMMYNAEVLPTLSDLCDKIQLLYNDDSTYVYKSSSMDDVPKNYIMEHFISGNAMMVTTMFLRMEVNFNDLTMMSYGIAPMPKFSEAQENYYSYVQDQVSSYGISAAVGDPDRQSMLSAVLESMAYHSYRLVRPAYYETVLSERYMQDPQSSEVLDLLFESLSFDFSSSCSGVFDCNPRSSLRTLLSGTKNTIASSTQSWKKVIENNLRGYNRKLDTLRP